MGRGGKNKKGGSVSGKKEPPKRSRTPSVSTGRGTAGVVAVLIADSFNRRFAPLSFETARALLPVCNAPLIDYSFEFLAANGVMDVIVFARSHAAKVTAHAEATAARRGMNVTSVLAPGCLTLGDALREIGDRGIIKTDFILLSGADVVSTVVRGGAGTRGRRT